MSWRWLVDVRGDEPRIDWSRLTLAVVVGEAIAGALVWSLMGSVGAPAMIILVLPIAALLIAIDVTLRRQRPRGQ